MNTPYPASGMNEAPQKNLLLVTGDLTISRKFRQLLMPLYKVETASTFTEGILQATQEHPQLILCDVQLQDSSGYQYLITLRNDPLLKYIPVILFSQSNMTANIRKGMNLGADDFLVYPFTGEELLKSVQSRLVRFHHIRDTLTTTQKEVLPPNVNEINTSVINERLSRTEAKILGMIAQGMSSRDIALFKDISVRTVDNHRHNISKKLQLSGPNALVKFAIGYTTIGSR
jgi:DNA-binding NarL/FixJ family response regulator